MWTTDKNRRKKDSQLKKNRNFFLAFGMRIDINKINSGILSRIFDAVTIFIFIVSPLKIRCKYNLCKWQIKVHRSASNEQQKLWQTSIFELSRGEKNARNPEQRVSGGEQGLYKNWNNKICSRQLINVAFDCELFTFDWHTTRYTPGLMKLKSTIESYTHTERASFIAFISLVNINMYREMYDGNGECVYIEYNNDLNSIRFDSTQLKLCTTLSHTRCHIS